jgi:hypothetical protein
LRCTAGAGCSDYEVHQGNPGHRPLFEGLHEAERGGASSSNEDPVARLDNANGLRGRNLPLPPINRPNVHRADCKRNKARSLSRKARAPVFRRNALPSAATIAFFRKAVVRASMLMSTVTATEQRRRHASGGRHGSPSEPALPYPRVARCCGPPSVSRIGQEGHGPGPEPSRSKAASSSTESAVRER